MTTSGENVFVPGESMSARMVAERIREAVKHAGGHRVVTTRSGIKGRTLSSLLGGQEPKHGQIVAVAETCGVSIEWLATGRGPLQRSAVAEAAPALPSVAPPEHDELRRMAARLLLIADAIEAQAERSERVCELLGAYARLSKREQARARAMMDADLEITGTEKGES